MLAHVVESLLRDTVEVRFNLQRKVKRRVAASGNVGVKISSNAVARRPIPHDAPQSIGKAESFQFRRLQLPREKADVAIDTGGRKLPLLYRFGRLRYVGTKGTERFDPHPQSAHSL